MKKPTRNDIYMARLNAELTQKEAAELINVARSAWAKWETGENSINLTAWELFQIKTGMIKVKKLR